MRRAVKLLLGGVVVTALLACRAAGPKPMTAPTPAQGTILRESALADSVRHSYTQADVDFMTGMIHHHAQAIVMARWAPTHDASSSLRVLAARIINAQRDEIATMQRWLRDHNLPAPEPDTVADHDMSMHHGMAMAGDMHGTLMPGMLTPEQMHELDAARGREFDQLFLRFMIQHHTGALTMVDSLFATNGAAQDDLVFKIASDINADQTTEIERMRTMLVAMLAEEWKRP